MLVAELVEALALRRLEFKRTLLVQEALAGPFPERPLRIKACCGGRDASRVYARLI